MHPFFQKLEILAWVKICVVPTNTATELMECGNRLVSCEDFKFGLRAAASESSETQCLPPFSQLKSTG